MGLGKPAKYRPSDPEYLERERALVISRLISGRILLLLLLSADIIVIINISHDHTEAASRESTVDSDD